MSITVNGMYREYYFEIFDKTLMFQNFPKKSGRNVPRMKKNPSYSKKTYVHKKNRHVPWCFSLELTQSCVKVK